MNEFISDTADWRRFDTFQGLVDSYEDTLEIHTAIRDDFFTRVLNDIELITLLRTEIRITPKDLMKSHKQWKS